MPHGRTTASRSRLAAVVASLTLVLAGCISGPDTDSDTVRARFSADPQSFDPAQLVGSDDYYASRMLFDTLLRYDDDGAIVGGLAEDWDFDAMGGTVELAEGATCADGTPIDAEVVADSLNRFASPDTQSGSKILVFGNGEVTASAQGPQTLDISLSEPFSELDAGLTMVASGIVCPAGLDDPEGLSAGSVPEAFSGPFTLTTATSGVEYVMELRSDYGMWPDFISRLEGRPPERMSFSVGDDVATNANEVLGGSLDLAGVSPTDTDRFPDVALVYIGEQYIVFNQHETSPFQDEELRRAVARTLSGEAYNEVTYAGRSEVEYTMGDAGMQCANSNEDLVEEYDREAVQSKGLLDGVEMVYSASNSFGPNGIGAEYVYQELSDAGAHVDYQIVDNSTWASLVLGPDAPSWDITLFGTVNQTNTLWTGVSRIMGTPIEDGGRSMSRADNPDGEQLADEVMRATDQDEKCEIYQELQENFLGRVDVVPLTASVEVFALADGIQYEPPNSRMDYTAVRVED